MAGLNKTIEEIIPLLEEQEKRQDTVLRLSRELVRECAKAVKHIHANELKECEAVVKELDSGIIELKKKDKGFEGISQISYQEYVEVKCLLSVLEKKDFPSLEQLSVPVVPYLNGLADCVGELRRNLQIALKKEKKKEAEYYFEKMNELYDNLMTIKFSSSLVGPLKRKQDVARTQLEQARSELLSFK